MARKTRKTRGKPAPARIVPEKGSANVAISQEA
jgi:hypothetical protein